jgi:hypothetical protein
MSNSIFVAIDESGAPVDAGINKDQISFLADTEYSVIELDLARINAFSRIHQAFNDGGFITNFGGVLRLCDKFGDEQTNAPTFEILLDNLTEVSA